MPAFVSRSILLLFTLLCVYHFPALGQHKAWRQFTLDDGLPSMNVWSIIQAKNRMLWFTSNKGIFSFDGYEFHEPVDTSVNRGTEAFFPSEDPSGRIWFSRLDRTVWYIEQDTVREWELNHALDSIRGNFLLIEQIGFDTNGDVWLHTGPLGFIAVNAKGELRKIRGSDQLNFLVGKIGDKLMFGFQSDIQRTPLRIEAISQMLLFEHGKMRVIGSAGFKKSIDLDFLNATAVDGKKIIIKGNMFNAKFEVSAPAQQPAPPGPPVPDSSSQYSGKGQFVTTNVKFKVS